MKITRLEVVGLFGLYDYTIDFVRHGEDMTVLTSPNGYGKTTILRIINSLNVCRLYYLYLLKFKSLHICFDNGSELLTAEPEEVQNKEKDSDKRKDAREGLSLIWKYNEKESCRFEYHSDILQPAKYTALRRVTSQRHYGGVEFSEESDEYFTRGEAGEALNNEIARMQGQEMFLLQLAAVQTDFIGANRIYSMRRRERPTRMRFELPILQVVYELRERLSSEVNEFQNNFQRLDSKFIDMLLADSGSDISEENYNQRAAKISARIEELVSFGLTNRQKLPAYNMKNSKVLDVYLDLMEEKLQYYKDLLPLVQLFNKNIQQKHFASKTIKLSPQHGLRIESDNGDILDADTLSTGEQNQIVLLYDLIFKTPKGSILLIDEPESSLHVAWQNDFVNDMQSIADSKKLQIVVASHSPIIVSNTPDNQVFDLYYLQSENNA